MYEDGKYIDAEGKQQLPFGKDIANSASKENFVHPFDDHRDKDLQKMYKDMNEPPVHLQERQKLYSQYIECYKQRYPTEYITAKARYDNIAEGRCGDRNKNKYDEYLSLHSLKYDKDFKSFKATVDSNVVLQELSAKLEINPVQQIEIDSQVQPPSTWEKFKEFCSSLKNNIKAFVASIWQGVKNLCGSWRTSSDTSHAFSLFSDTSSPSSKAAMDNSLVPIQESVVTVDLEGKGDTISQVQQLTARTSQPTASRSSI